MLAAEEQFLVLSENKRALIQTEYPLYFTNSTRVKHNQCLGIRLGYPQLAGLVAAHPVNLSFLLDCDYMVSPARNLDHNWSFDLKWLLFSKYSSPFVLDGTPNKQLSAVR